MRKIMTSISNKPICKDLVIDTLTKQLEQRNIDIMVLNRRLDRANAALDAVHHDTGKLLNLNDLKSGAKVVFRNTSPGIVLSINNEIKGINDDVVSAKASIKHDNGVTSYHTYRFDGMSFNCPSFDIQKIFID